MMITTNLKRQISDSYEPILVTEKDYVKIKQFNIKNIYILEQEITPNDKLMKMIERIL